MRIEFHVLVSEDLQEACDYYDQRGANLASRIQNEFREAIELIRENPRRFPFYLGGQDLRRARLKHFPYIILYREGSGWVKILIFKNERRHPRYGVDRE